MNVAQRVLGLLAAATLLQPAAADVPVAASSDGTALNVTIPVFDAGIPDDPSVYREQQVFPRIREIEAKLMPFLLRETLAEAGGWGAVRVVTRPEQAAELQVFGTIVHSDGERLELHIRVQDATGRTWLDEVFTGVAKEAADVRAGSDGTPEFRSLYEDIAAALAGARDGIDVALVRNVKRTSLILYAIELAPSAFREYLEQAEDGLLQVERLPARDDPMLRRIETIRNTEFLITDTVDSKYRELNADLARTYRVWREYRRKFRDYEAENVRFAAARNPDVPRGSWESIKHQYDTYKYDRVTAQERDRLAVAFNTEVTATVAAMETRVAELEGWVEKGYGEWRALLEELFEVESYMLEQGITLSE